MKRIIFYIVSLIVLCILVAFAYQFAINFTYTRHIQLPPQLLASTSTDASPNASSTVTGTAFPDPFGQTDDTYLNPASSTVDTSSWSVYSNKELGFSVQYPQNLFMDTNTPGTLTLSFSKDVYFHWPLLDDVKITIIATSSCPVIATNNPDTKSFTVTTNGYNFNRLEGSDVGAGNIYREMAFDVTSNNTCYHLDLFDHGTNGAGFYVGDQSLIARYDAQHQADLNAVLGVFMGVVNSFRLML